MIAQKEESLKAQREADSAKLEEYTEAFKALGVDVITIKCEREVKHVTDRINYVIKPFIEDRINRWEKNNMLPIERHRAKDFLTHYIAADSRFGKLNPYSLIENPRPYPLIYNDRIYYFKDEE